MIIKNINNPHTCISIYKCSVMYKYIGDLSEFHLMGFEKRFQNISTFLSYQFFSEQCLQMRSSSVCPFVRGAQKKTPSH